MNQDSIQKIYEEISQLQLELEADPTILGPRYINQITSKCRNHLNKVTLIRLRVSREKRELKSRTSGEETLLDAERDQLLATDETVRRQPNMRDREAVANTILRERLNGIAALKNELLDLDTVEKAVTLVHEELIRTSNEIKTQRSLLLSDRSSGAAYGDEYDGPRDEKGNPLAPKSIDEKELDRIMAGGEPLVAEAQPVEDLVLPEGLAKTDPKAEEAPAPLPPATKAALVEVVTQTKKVDPSAGVKEEPEVLLFLAQEPEKPVVTAKPAVTLGAGESDDDFFANILQNF